MAKRRTKNQPQQKISPAYLATTIGLVAVIIVSVVVTVAFQNATTGHNVSYAAGSSTGIGGKPAHPRPDDARSQSIFIHEIKPGETINEGVLVINNDKQAEDVRVYATDSAISSGGAFACAQFGDTAKEVGSWIGMDKTQLSVPAGGKVEVPFTITAPQQVDVGEHNGCIVIERNNLPDNTKPGINIQTRSAIRVELTVPGEIKREVAITGVTVTGTEDGSKLITIDAVNKGNVSVEAMLHVVTRYPWGRGVSSQGGYFLTLAGQTAQFSFKIPRPFWGGWFKTTSLFEVASQGYTGPHGPHLPEDQHMILEGTDFVPHAQLFPDLHWPSTADVDLPGPTTTFFSMPRVGALLLYVAIFALVVLVAALWMLSVRRRHWIKRAWKNYAVKPSDDLHAIAERHAVSWKVLARANRLKPPFTLHSGQKIKVPPPKRS